MITIDGRMGEGGGQVLRTSLSLSALTKRPFHITHIRANRSKPGLRPQHLTAVQAVAAVCGAETEGATLNSRELLFRPQTTPHSDVYRFDVGTAGSTTLIMQTVLWPLLFADGPAEVILTGGTHVPFSPPYHYLAQVMAPAMTRLGADVELDLEAWGWYPQGQGRIKATVTPISRLQAADFTPQPVKRVEGVAAVTNLPAHIPHRMARRADNLLAEAGYETRIQPLRERGAGPGAGIILWAPQGGATSLGRKGVPAEHVAETAVAQLRAFIDNKGAVDPYLADQLLLPLALANGRSTTTTTKLTRHTLTNAQLLRRWLDLSLTIDGEEDNFAQITIDGINFAQ